MLEYEGPVADRSTPNDAADAADRAATIYRELGNRTGEGTALNTMAQARLRQNKLGQASKVAEQALGIFREKGETRSMVKALELIVEVHTLQSNPMAGLQAANREVSLIRRAGNRRGEATLLELIAKANATLGQHRGAIAAAQEAVAIYAAMEDNMGQGGMFHTLSQMRRALGEMAEATSCAEHSLRCYRAAGCGWGEEQALKNISSLLVERGQPEKAPKRAETQQALKDLQKAIQMRRAEDVATAEAKLDSMGNLVADADIQNALLPVLERDPAAVDFLRDQGWSLAAQEKQESVGSKIKQFDHESFYFRYASTALVYGPQFRAVQPYRIGSYGANCASISVLQLPETEHWQMDMSFRPGIMDGILQSGAAAYL